MVHACLCCDNWCLLWDHLGGCFWLFVPKFWESGRDLWMILCHSMDICWKVGMQRGAGDTLQLNSFKLFAFTSLWDAKTSPFVPTHTLASTSTHSNLVKHSQHLINIFGRHFTQLLASWTWDPRPMVLRFTIPGNFHKKIDKTLSRSDLWSQHLFSKLKSISILLSTNNKNSSYTT